MLPLRWLQLLLLGGVPFCGGSLQWWPFGGGASDAGDPWLLSPENIACPRPHDRGRFDHRPNRRRLRLATFNAEWLFDGVGDGRVGEGSGGLQRPPICRPSVRVWVGTGARGRARCSRYHRFARSFILGFDFGLQVG